MMGNFNAVSFLKRKNVKRREDASSDYSRDPRNVKLIEVQEKLRKAQSWSFKTSNIDSLTRKINEKIILAWSELEKRWRNGVLGMNKRKTDKSK